MPGFDGTGPRGRGPMTGGGRGFCAVPPLTLEEMSSIKRAFSQHRNVMTVYEAVRPEVVPLNLQEMRRRRPEEGE